MTTSWMPISRRGFFKTAGALTVAGLAPAIVRGQGAPLQLGILTPLTGAGGVAGPGMAKAMKAVMDEVNAAGGLLGRKVELIVEDTETNPESAVRAARKLIDVNKVPVIMGTWASSVTTAVAPLCWESKTFLTTTSGADSITLLPHQGYLIRTQPNNHLQATKHAEFMAALGAKRCFIMSIQAPFARPTQDRLTEVLKQHGSEMVGGLIYDKDKTTYRSEVDEALRANPDLIYLNGYAPDATVLLRDLYRAGYSGVRFAQSYAVTGPVLAALPNEATEGLITVQPSADIGSPAYALAKKRLGVDDLDSYTCAATDWASLVALAIAKAKVATGTGIRDNVRKISQGSGTKVYSAVEGLKLLAQGKEINYEGASGPCDFTDIGDIIDCKFRYNKVHEGKLTFLKVA
jgi:ABC-type branched-subunit amino acid transport system substrate-binding protein